MLSKIADMLPIRRIDVYIEGFRLEAIILQRHVVTKLSFNLRKITHAEALPPMYMSRSPKTRFFVYSDNRDASFNLVRPKHLKLGEFKGLNGPL